MSRSSTFTLIIVLLISSSCTPLTSKDGQLPAGTATPSSSAPISLPELPPPGSQIHFKRISLEAGLSESTVIAIIQDEMGFMWFGTEDGLNRYDGEKFKIFRPIEGESTSISDVWVSSLELDANGSLWAGTRQGGANSYNTRTGTFTRYQHQIGRADSLSSNYVHTIFSDAQGRLWFGTELGLDLLDPRTASFKHFLPEGVENISIDAIVQDRYGYLWIGSSTGLWRFDPDKGTFTNYKTSNIPSSIFDILIDPEGDFWLASRNDGLIHFDPDTGNSTSYTTKAGLSYNVVNNLYFDRSGWIWVGTAYGLNLFDPNSGTFFNYFNDPFSNNSLSRNSIQSLYQDSEGILWVGTYGGGVSVYDPLANKFSHYYHKPDQANSLSENMIFAISPAPDDSVWIGTAGGGLEHFDPDRDMFTHYKHDASTPKSLRNNYINSVLVARDGNIWVGTLTGLDRLDPTTGIFTHFPSGRDYPGGLPGDQVLTLYQDRSDSIWVGLDNGLVRYNPARNSFTNLSQPNDSNGLYGEQVTSIHEDPNGLLWVGTFGGGLRILDLWTGIYKPYRNDPKTPGTISNDSITDIFESHSGTIWVTTAGGGINRYDPVTDSFSVINESDGLPNNIVYGVLEEEDGRLWMSTNYGLVRFNPESAEIRSFTIADGLQSNEFNSGAFAQTSDGSMYFGGINGINRFHPAEIRSNLFLAPVRLVSLTYLEKPVVPNLTPEVLQQVEIKYPDNSFEFEFAELSYSQSNQNLYAYMLEGYDNNWFYSGSIRSGRYANLPGGEYILRLKAANSDGIWNDEGLSLQVTVIPPFWQTVWFYTLIGFTLLGVIYSIHRLRVHNIEMQKKELESQVTERTLEMEQLFEKTKDLAIVEERNRLARELHDSAKQKAFAALAQLGTANGVIKKDPISAISHLTEAENLVYEVIEELTFLIQEMYPVALKEKGLVATLREYIFDWENRTDIQVDVNIQGNRHLELNIEQAIYRVTQEALSNVSRHSQASHVDLELTFNPDHVKVVIADNGCGFDNASKPNGVGLRSIRERIESLSGSVEIASLPECGTSVTVFLPLDY